MRHENQPSLTGTGPSWPHWTQPLVRRLYLCSHPAQLVCAEPYWAIFRSSLRDFALQTAVTGLPHTPRFPVKFRGSRKPHAPLLKERRTRGLVQGCVQEIRHLARFFARCGIPRRYNRKFFPPNLHRLEPKVTSGPVLPCRKKKHLATYMQARKRLYLLEQKISAGGASHANRALAGSCPQFRPLARAKDSFHHYPVPHPIPVTK